MFNFLEENTNPVEKNVERVDGVALMMEIGEGIEELTYSQVQLDILSKAQTALGKSMELDNAIAAQGVANKATVTYGIEALEMSATFLGVQLPDSIAAGIEDNAQDKVEEKKAGFFKKVVEGVKKAIEKVWQFILGLVDKVKKFFAGKAVEATVEKIEKTAEKIDENPECSEDKKEKAEELKKKIVEAMPLYFAADGKIEQAKDVANLFNALKNNGALEYIKEINKVFDGKSFIKELELVKKVADATAKEDKKLSADASKALGKLKDTYVGVIEKLSGVSYKPANDIEKKIISEYGKVAIDEVKKSLQGKDIKDYKFEAILLGLGATKGQKNTKVKIGVVYHNENALKTAKKVAEEFKSFTALTTIFKDIDFSIDVKEVEVKVDEEKAIKNISILGKKDIEEIAKTLKDNQSDFEKGIDEMQKDINELKKEVEDVLNGIEKATGANGTLANEMISVVKSITTTASSSISSNLKVVLGATTKVANNLLDLSKLCSKSGSTDLLG